MSELITKIKVILFLILLSAAAIIGQEREERTGTVTYISSQNVYVKFDNTTGILTGDTLYSRQNGKSEPAVFVKHISSRSCAGELINGIRIKEGDNLFAYVKTEIPPLPEQAKKTNYFDSVKLSVQEIKQLKNQVLSMYEKTEKYRGRLSVQSYTNFSNYDRRAEYQRWRYTLSFNGESIANTNFSISNYMSFAYKAQDWSKISSNPIRNLRVYELAGNYRINDYTILWLGRHLNKRITNISAVDGIQFERKLSLFTAGLLAGSRPDFNNNMGFNFKLFEFGGYIARTDSVAASVMDNNLAVIQQTNNFQVDRRFIYFQHSNDIIPNASIFFSSEIDLFKKIKGIESTEFILTGLFLSARYTPHRVASFSLSYDARKNVIYYETFKNFIDSVYENETRHGLRFGTILRPIDFLSLSVNGGYRFIKGDIKPSRNLNGNLSYSSLPIIESSSTVSYTQIKSNHLDGSIIGIRLSKTLTVINSDISAAYRYTSYTLLSRNTQIIQKSLLTDLSVRVVQNLSLNMGFEAIFEENRSSGRILIDITTRF